MKVCIIFLALIALVITKIDLFLQINTYIFLISRFVQTFAATFEENLLKSIEGHEDFPLVKSIVLDKHGKAKCGICEKIVIFLHQRKNDVSRAGHLGMFHEVFAEIEKCFQTTLKGSVSEDNYRVFINNLHTLLRSLVTNILSDLTSDNCYWKNVSPT